jgi:hypothetical protein
MKLVPIRNSECGRFRKHLGSLLTDDLPKDRRQKVLRHALRCMECLSELQLLAEVSERIRHAVKSGGTSGVTAQNPRVDSRRDPTEINSPTTWSS